MATCGEESLLSVRRDQGAESATSPSSESGNEDGKSSSQLPQTEDVPTDQDSYGTRYPIAWRGERGWQQELENKGGPEAVGVRLTGEAGRARGPQEEEVTEDHEGKAFADRVEAARVKKSDAEKQMRRHGSSKWFRVFSRFIRREPLLYVAILVVLVLTVICGAAEFVPSEIVSFVMSGGLFSRPLIRAAPRHPSLKNLLVALDEFKRIWDRVWSSTTGEVLLHMFLGIVTVWIIAAVHMNRVRALLTLLVTSLGSTVAIGSVMRKHRAARAIRDDVHRFKRALSDIPGLRALNSIIPSGESTAKIITQLSTLLTAFLIPVVLYSALARFFPLTTRWITDDLSKNTVIKLLLVPVILAYIFFNARHLLHGTSTEEQQQRRSSPSYSSSSSGGRRMTPSLVTAWAVVLCAFVILRYVSPENAQEDTRNMLERYTIEGVLPNFETKYSNDRRTVS